MHFGISNHKIITSLVKNITAELDARDWSLMRLSEEANVPYDTIKKLLSGKIQNPHLCNIAKIAFALNTDINTLSGLTSHSVQIIETGHTSNMIKFLMEFENSLTITKKYQRKNIIPVFLPLSTNQNPERYSDSVGIEPLAIDDYEDFFGNRIAYGIRIRNNTYHPVYYQNDTILIARDRAPVSGETGIFIHNGKLLIRRFIDGTSITLEPVNSIGSPIYLSSLENWTIAGYVLGVFR